MPQGYGMIDGRSRIFTRTGDGGVTRLADGTRLAKDHPRIEVLGALDELNCLIGLTRAQGMRGEVEAALVQVQGELCDLGAELADPGSRRIEASQVRRLEAQIDAWALQLPPLRTFILPGSGPMAASCHVARAVCRRAERSWVHLAATEVLNPEGLCYLNRLSDFLFTLARVLAKGQGEEVPWRPHPPMP